MAGNSLAINLRNILNERDKAAHRAGREALSIQILAVSKKFPAETIKLAHSLGQNIFGENYVQEWEEKAKALADLDLQWHFVGSLQSKKAKQVVGKVKLIHSLDRDSLAEAISKSAQELGRKQDVLVEMNVAEESSKSGLKLNDAHDKIRYWSALPGLNLCGLMVMPPPSDNPEDSRPHFRQAKEWLEEWRSLAPDHSWNQLSMGTTQDFRVAIEEGSTLIRVGKALFGPRPKSVR